MRRTGGGADDAGLGDRCVDDPLLAVLRLQPLGGLECSAEGADILAETENVRIACHFFVECFANRLEKE